MRVSFSSPLFLTTMFLVGFLPGLRAQMDSAVLKAAPVVKAEAYGKLPLSFEANHGQTDAQVRFLSRGNGYSLFLTDSAAVLSLRKGEVRPKAAGLMGLRAPQSSQVTIPKTDVVRMELAGARRGLRVEGAEKLPGTSNYFIGNDPAKWRSSVPTYAKVRYGEVYPGVDLVYYGNQSQLEYDFVVAPHADARPIRLRFAGTRRLKLNANGDLAVIARNGEIAFHKPVVYQEIGGKRQAVEGHFALLGKHDVGFSLGSYDRERAVVIDPVLAYSTYLGGSLGSYQSNYISVADNGIAIDADGNSYLAGSTYAGDFPTTQGAYHPTVTSAGTPAVFVSKLNASGTALVYSTYIAANQHISISVATSIAVDSSGNAYITGYTSEFNYPVTPGAFQQTVKASPHAFVTKLRPDGSALIYSSLLGGSVSTYGEGIAIDKSGNAYLTGYTYDKDFPVTSGAFQQNNNGSAKQTTNAWVAKVNSSGTALLYSTYLGGSGRSASLGDTAFGIRVDDAGDAYVIGETYSTNFPVTPGSYQTTPGTLPSAANAFVTKLNTSGTALIYSTYFGGTTGLYDNGSTHGLGIAIDTSRNAYLTGYTYSTDLPSTPGAFEPYLQGPANTVGGKNSGNAFVAKLNAAGNAVVYSSYLGGNGNGGSGNGGITDFGLSIAVDESGYAYVTGGTPFSNFPLTCDAYQKIGGSAINTRRNTSVFLTKVNPTGTMLAYSSYLGGYTENTHGDKGNSIAVDSSGNAYVAGITNSTNFPTTPGAFQTTSVASSSTYSGVAFVSRFATGSGTSGHETCTTVTSNANPQTAGAPVLFTAYVQPLFGASVPTGAVNTTIDGKTSLTLSVDNTGHAVFATNALPAGAHAISATYSGSAFFTGSSGSLVETITGSTGTPSIIVAYGAGQISQTGTQFSDHIVVQVANGSGVAMPNVAVSFSGVGLKFATPTVVTDSTGLASVFATPLLGGFLNARASVDGTSLSVPFVEIGVATPIATPPGFAAMAILPTGASASGASLQAAVGDFNGDGIVDLATTNTIDASVSVLQGKGDGTFKAAVNYGTGAGPYGVAADDFNGDGKADLAVVNGLDGTVSVLLNSASGLPATPSFTYAVGSQPYGVSVADLNRDGVLDLVVTNNASNSVSVLLGKGDGSFQAALPYAVGSAPFGTAVADFNRDGYPDLVVWNYGDNTVGVLLNTTAGTFLPQTTYAAGPGPFSVTTGDFNGDGYPDLAVALLGTKASAVGANAVKVLLNNKAGGFAAGVSYAVGTYPTAALAQDLNGDGVLDLAMTNLGDGTVSVLVGKGDGTFLGQTAYQAGSEPYGLASGDFNGDGKADLAVTNIYSNSIGVLLQGSSTVASKTKGLPPRTLKTDPPQ